MRNNVYLFLCGISLMTGLQLLGACHHKSEVTQASIEKSADGHSVFGKSTEEKLDDFLSDYIKDLKNALAETDDKIAAAKIQQMKEKYGPRAEKLQLEVESWETSLSEEEMKAFEQRTENKPYFKDLLTTSVTAIGRVNQSPEIRKALEELNTHVDVLDKDIGTEETTGEEYPEEITEEKIEHE
jgi:hypothetical protein